MARGLITVAAVAVLVLSPVLPPLSAALPRHGVTAAAPAQSRALLAPPILAKSAYLLDVQSGAALFQKFPNARRPMASTAKTMTGLLAAESGRLDEIVEVSRAAASVGETTMGLVAGERVPLRELLYGLILNSGNDAAVAIAEHLGGSDAGFAAHMNARAETLGLHDTLFANPHGLDHSVHAANRHYSTARDLAVLGAAALANPILREVAATTARDVPGGEDGVDAHRLRHTISALWWYPGAIGVKTGWTAKAGQVRIVAAERAGTRLVAVVMGSPDHTRETRDLLDYGFALSEQAAVRATVPLGPEAFAVPEPRIVQAWETYKRLALAADGRIRQGPRGDDATSDGQAAALLHAAWLRDRTAFDAIWHWTQIALSRRQRHDANPYRDWLFASRWSGGNVTDWANSTGADQRLAAALLLASRAFNEPAYDDEAQRILGSVLDRAAVSWDVRGVPAAGWSITAANSLLKEIDPVTTTASALTPAFYRMFAEATRNVAWLWALEGTYAALSRATAAGGAVGSTAGILPGWFSVARDRGAIDLPIDPSWQSTGFTSESAMLAWQLALEARWNGDRRAATLLDPTARLLARELAQRGRIAAAYGPTGVPAPAETSRYGALAGIAVVEPAIQPALRSKIDAALASNDAARVLDAIDGLWLLAGGPPNYWRIWNPPLDLPVTRRDAVEPPGDGYPWRYFEETGHTVYGPTLEFFHANGGLPAFGFPRTGVFVEDGQTVQYFQRARLELAPDGTVTGLTPLGARAAARRGVYSRPEAARVAPFESDEERLYFPETGHSLSRGFKAFFERHGGVAVIGAPLTEEMMEDGFTVQYFERMVLEYQPGRPIQATLLGDDFLREKGWLK